LTRGTYVFYETWCTNLSSPRKQKLGRLSTQREEI
jgi:hypothetical protein